MLRLLRDYLPRVALLLGPLDAVAPFAAAAAGRPARAGQIGMYPGGRW